MIQRECPSLLVEMFIIISKAFLRAQREDGLVESCKRWAAIAPVKLKGFEAPWEPAQFLGCRGWQGGGARGGWLPDSSQ